MPRFRVRNVGTFPEPDALLSPALRVECSVLGLGAPLENRYVY